MSLVRQGLAGSAHQLICAPEHCARCGIPPQPHLSATQGEALGLLTQPTALGYGASPGLRGPQAACCGALAMGTEKLRHHTSTVQPGPPPLPGATA